MLKALLAAGLAIALPLNPAHALGEEVDYESAIRCAGVIGFFAGMAEGEDAALAEEMAIASTVWFTMASMRSDDEEQMDADTDRLLEWLEDEIESKSDDDEALEAFMGGEFEKCFALREAAKPEYAEIEAGIAALTDEDIAE